MPRRPSKQRDLEGPDDACPGFAGRRHLSGSSRYATRIKEQTKSPDMPNIGVNYLSADRPLWFTLADCVASKLLTGKAPKVVRAIRFSAKPPQPNLRAVGIAGNRAFRVDPYKDDFYKRVIELRRRVKGDLKDSK